MATIFNEDNTIEQMMLSTLQKNGWKYIPAEELPRMYSDVLVEPMVKEALIRLNPEIAEDPSRADEVIYKLRTLILSVQPHNLVTQNEIFKKMIFEENSYPFGKDGRMVPIRFFGTMRKEDLALNEYVVTNQWIYPQAEGGKRLDIVLLINGFPIAIGELKTPVRSAITWLDAAGDISAYEKSIPAMFVTNVFNFATEGKCYRYGSINMPINMWGPWHTATHKSEGSLADVKISVEDMISPKNVMDIFQFFTMFATDKKYRKYKIICRYQQFEGANMIVNRVIAGYPKKGLIWHFQGSGKSLLMVFAAQKLRMIPELKNPTVVIVDDRIDLETQITATFNASDIPNLTSAATKEELLSFFRGDMRKILITTIFKFGEVSGELNPRDNIIVMVDEAHRTQEGDLGEKMRMALPNAFFFGLTGTPINRVDKNTFATFGAEEDRTGYMSRYSFSDSIRDGATLPLHFEPVPVELHVDKEKLDREFEAMTDEAGLSKDEKNELSRRVNMKAIMYNPARIRKVCEHIAKHFKEKIEPNGYKGQVVVYDRECCLMYKAVLDELLGEEASTIVMDTNNDKEDRYKKYRRDRDAEGKVLDTFRDPASPLKLVIVTAKLLTGFDAPILQVMYLDKPMKDHTLLQAICRTNRTYDQGKTHGLIVDYIGIFDDVARALDFDENSMRISAIAYLKEQGKEWRNVAVYGQEINALTSAIGKMNLFLHGVKDFNIVNGDTLKAPAFVENGRLKQFDLILANPPYSISQWDRAAFESDKYGRNFLGVPPQGRADYAFLQHIIASLKDDTGRCAILFPHGVLFRNEESAMRERLVRSDKVECVIGLGPNLFYNSPMEACIMICRMNKRPERRGQVLFINAVNEVERKNAQSYLEERHIARIAAAYDSYVDDADFAKVATIQDIANNNFSLSIPLYVKPEVNEEEIDNRNVQEHYDSWLAASEMMKLSYEKLNALLVKEADVNE